MQTETDSFTDSMEDKKFDIQTQTNRPTNQLKDSRAREGEKKLTKRFLGRKGKEKKKERKRDKNFSFLRLKETLEPRDKENGN